MIGVLLVYVFLLQLNSVPHEVTMLHAATIMNVHIGTCVHVVYYIYCWFAYDWSTTNICVPVATKLCTT